MEGFLLRIGIGQLFKGTRILRRNLLFLWLIFFLLGIQALALEVPEKPQGRVTDYTGTLSPNEKGTLERKLADFERETTNQIAVLLIPSLQGESLEDYSIRLAEKWKIGQKGKNNGVILLIVKNDHKLRIEVGYGLEGALPDALSGSIIRNEIAPRFKTGHFFLGIEAGLNAIMAATQGEYKPVRKRRSGSQFSSWGMFLPFLLLFGLFAFLSLFARKKHFHSGGSGGWTSGGGFLGGGSSWGDSGGGFSGGGGDFGGGGSSGDW
jgi:uncharacterized protein